MCEKHIFGGFNTCSAEWRTVYRISVEPAAERLQKRPVNGHLDATRECPLGTEWTLPTGLSNAGIDYNHHQQLIITEAPKRAGDPNACADAFTKLAFLTQSA